METVSSLGDFIHIMSKQKYDEAFKRNAVGLVESGVTAAQVARDLGLKPNQVYGWCQTYRKAPSTHGNLLSSQDEVTRLRRELSAKIGEIDVLKKALGIFSRSIL